MKKFLLFIVSISLLHALPTYTGYSGGNGSKGTCSSTCHGSGTGTITVSGIPSAYVPLATYTVTVRHNGGSKISNFNLSSRIGSTSSIAGNFTAGLNAALYSIAGTENGVRASVNSIDSVVFLWRAPIAGSGDVKVYLSGLQGTKSGPVTKLVISSSEAVTGVTDPKSTVETFNLDQNYPNPFNPSTVIRYTIPRSGRVEIKIFDMIGNEIRTLVNQIQEKGTYSVKVDIADQSDASVKTLASGVYFYSLRMSDRVLTKRMVVVK